tara:strand:- start:3439 stop:4407 length:969 start_codon:yes stop_codon:yes gene_type:complete
MAQNETEALVSHLTSLTGDEQEKLIDWCKGGDGHGLMRSDFYSFLPDELVDGMSERTWSDMNVIGFRGTDEASVELRKWLRYNGKLDCEPMLRFLIHQRRQLEDESLSDEEMREWGDGLSNVVLFAFTHHEDEITDWVNLNRVRWLKTYFSEPKSELTTGEKNRIEETVSKLKEGRHMLTSDGDYEGADDAERYRIDATESELSFHQAMHEKHLEYEERGFTEQDAPDGWIVVPVVMGSPMGIVYGAPHFDNSAYMRRPLGTHYCAKPYVDGVQNGHMLGRVARVVNPKHKNTMMGRGSGARVDGEAILSALGFDDALEVTA